MESSAAILRLWATINATTLIEKLGEVVDMMTERSLDILDICETRMIGEGWTTVHNNFELIYKVMETEKK